MGWSKDGRCSLALPGIGAVVLIFLTGCQTVSGPLAQRLVEHQAQVELVGLDTLELVESLKVSCAAPLNWHILPLNKNALYTHQQWRSPSRSTGVGVVYVRLPLPLNAKTLVWFAKAEYSKKRDDGRIIAQWTDSLGRPWFEAENNRYHAKGYAVTHGFDAWIIYTGYKIASPPAPDETGLAERCLETILPTPLGLPAADTRTASVQ